MMIKREKIFNLCIELLHQKMFCIDAIPLATKPAPIVNFQIHRKGRNGYYEIIRADGSAKTYLLFSQMLKEFDRQDLENLWKLVKAKHGNTRPGEGYERVLWRDLKTMFEHHIEDLIWRNLQGNKVLQYVSANRLNMEYPFRFFKDNAILYAKLLNYDKTAQETTEVFLKATSCDGEKNFIMKKLDDF
ncbi:hypothetical protein Tco_0678982 [Tanacetum coccineum]|uniref:Uncharacterized protein n=1 Tax=Tanacetum coccineum TaxID=301880 RepID=A0ABQ4XHK3_9ASTR